MDTIKRGTTPSFICRFDPEQALVTDIQSAVLSVQNGDTVTHHMLDELTVYALDNSIAYTFSQEETLAFKADTRVIMELHILLNDDRKCAAELEAVVRRSLYNEVMV